MLTEFRGTTKWKVGVPKSSGSGDRNHNQRLFNIRWEISIDRKVMSYVLLLNIDVCTLNKKFQGENNEILRQTAGEIRIRYIISQKT